jgi:hypothetical protein
MEITDIKIFLVSSAFLLLAEFLWNFFMLVGALYLVKRKEVLYTKHFYYYIIYGAFASTLVDRGFRYAISSFPFLSDLWQKTGPMQHLGFMIIPIVILMIVHYFLAGLVLNFDDKTSFKMALILGILTAPWPTFFSNI